MKSVKQLKSCFILKLSHVPYTELATQMDLQRTTTTHYSSSPFSSLSEISYEGIIFALPAVVRFYHRVSWIYFLPKLISWKKTLGKYSICELNWIFHNLVPVGIIFLIYFLAFEAFRVFWAFWTFLSFIKFFDFHTS